MAEPAEPRAETFERLAAACDRALERRQAPNPLSSPDGDLLALIRDIRARTLGYLADRLARTNALFRDANEEIAAVARDIGVDPIPLLCECATLRCTTIVRVWALEYEDIRADPIRFLNLPEHELESGPHAHVVADHGSYVIIENLGVAGSTAAALANGSGRQDRV